MESRIGLVVILLVTALAGAVVVAAAPAGGQTGVVAQQTAVDADDVRITITVAEDGTAEWELAFRSVLDTDDRKTAFESLQADIAEDPAAYTDPFAERIRQSVAGGENATGREMTAEGFSVETDQQSLGREYGIVTYRFTWEHFAATADNELRIGDAIDGFFLDDQTRLRVQWPEGYTADSVTPAADETLENAVVWDGAETDFVSGEPRVVAAGGGGLGPGVVLAVVAVVLLGGVGGWLYRRRSARADDGSPAAVESGAAVGSDAAVESDASTAGPTDGGASTPAVADDDPDPELLSNEEQVLRLLDEHGGRMKQKQVVEELEWTDAKTSKVVSGLREEGTIDSFRIGRENVLTYPDEGVLDDK